MEGQEQELIKKIDELLKHTKKDKIQDKNFVEALPQSFKEFLLKKQIPIDQMLIQIPRYIRVKPNYDVDEQKLAELLQIDRKQILQIDPQFYALQPSLKINHTQPYQQSLIYGIDYSSAIPIRCLQAQEGNKVLELCSAPGNKSMYLADKLQEVSITAVQINQNRAQIMKNLVNKYGLSSKIQVKVEDGLKFKGEELYDRVLIDAECTHEGSIKHLKKFMKNEMSMKEKKDDIKKRKRLSKQQQKQYQKNNSNPYTSNIQGSNNWTEKDFEERFLDPVKLSNLQKLQYGLLVNGFENLKGGGILVYSTCSFDKQQNERLIKKFIASFIQSQNSKYLPVVLDASAGLSSALACEKCEQLEQAIRLNPKTSRTGGMFICKLMKKPKEHNE